MRIALGSDHAGYEGPVSPYKPEIQKHLEERGHEVVDCGTNGPASVDYPDFAVKVGQTIQAGDADRGVLLCGTGIGISMAANRLPGIRAATVASEKMARLSRKHNDANVICLGRRISTLEECLRFIDIWLETGFSGGERHVRRIEKMG
jgi:ribose 5-phosphate isomerase B